MDASWQRPNGQILNKAPQAYPRVTQPTDDDYGDDGDGDEVSVQASSVKADSLLNYDGSLVGNRDRCGNERNTDQSCTPTGNFVRAERVQPQLDSKKRKSHALSIFIPVKKVKVEENTSLSQSFGNRQLPAQVWQRIFTFLPPKMLGRLLSISKSFNFLLNPLSNYACNGQFSPHTGSLLSLKPEAIWQLSRRRFWPTMPTPLRGHTELQMWQLACQTRCQFHDRAGQDISAYGSSNAENKHTTSRPIWPFALRSCPPCLVDRTIKEVDLLLSSSIPSCLIQALPFIFVDDKMRLISSAMLQNGHSNLKSPVTKLFLSSHAATIREEFALVMEMGEATAEEWIKGLEGRGKKCRADSLRWEKFEISGGLDRMQQYLSPDCSQTNSKANKAPKPSQLLYSFRKQEGPQNKLRGSNPSGIAPATSIHSPTCSRETSCVQLIPGHQVLSGAGIPRNKTRDEAEEMKAARRAEIEKRAAKLKPPIPAHILALCPAFQAAIQITTPLDDTAWHLLKPQLIGDRDQGKQGKRKALDHSEIPFRQLGGTRTPQKLRLETKQQVDKTWDDTQVPLRARISVLADQIIRDGWGNGRRINKESSPQFAAEVLLYVRKQFYAETEKDDVAARAAGQEPISDASNGPYTRKLTLENMRWLFDVKIRPVTESYGKELFYCHNCGFNTKPYGLEGVVQHYAAKHTSCLSLGAVVVYWRAEWPAVPPFHPKPHNLKQQQTGLRRQKSTRILGVIPQDKPPHQAQQHIYNATPLQPAPVRGPNPFQRQAFQSLDNPPFVGTTCHGPIQADQSAGVHRPIRTTNVDAYQSHSSTYQNHSGQEPQASHVSSPIIVHEKLNEIARDSRELWLSIAPIKKLPGPIRIFVVIHHVAARFRARFLEEPSLSLFMDGLSNNKEMRPVRNLNGLHCKACCLGLGVTTVVVEDKESYSLPQLVKHFHHRHIEQQYTIGAPVLNWCTDMVFLPDLSILSNPDSLRTTDSRKRSLVYSALSGVTSSESQLQEIRYATTLFANSTTDYRSYSHAPRPSTQLVSTQEPRGQHMKIVQHVSQRGPESHNADENISKTTQPAPCSMAVNGLDIIAKPSISRAGHPSTHKSSAYTTTTFNTTARTDVPSVRQTSSLHRSPASPDAVKDDEDDGFDLIASLESQLDRQASSATR
ncbi:hypothetical protein GGR51DRAFT_512140 [Nemania sp. FL0031]|nr:hypothetical protein GGR51DRAFT_512140 [Nemania sp. FL0031]